MIKIKKILLIIFILLSSFVIADSDSTFHTSKIGNDDTYFNSWAGNNNLGNFFDKGFLTLQELILEDIQWFNTALFDSTTTGGALSHLLMLSSIISIVTIAEVSLNPALMTMAALSMFFFGWFMVLYISIIIGFFMFPFSTIYLMRMVRVARIS